MSSDAKKETGTFDAGSFLESFMSMQKRWAETLSGMSGMWGSGGAPAPGIMGRMQQAVSTYGKLFGLFGATPFAAAVLRQPGGGAAEVWQEALSKMAANWAKFVVDLSRRAFENLQKGESRTDRVQDLYSSMIRTYEETLGRFINIPAIGPARYGVEKLGRSADTFLKFQTANVDFYGKLFKTGLDAVEEVLNQSREIFEGEITDETFDQFYHALMNVGEKRYYQLFTSTLFKQSIETMISNGLDFYKSWRELFEELLKATPIVTQSQADEVHKEIYLLRKRLSELERGKAR